MSRFAVILYIIIISAPTHEMLLQSGARRGRNLIFISLKQTPLLGLKIFQNTPKFRVKMGKKR
jgi:hypothetical protein